MIDAIRRLDLRTRDEVRHSIQAAHDSAGVRPSERVRAAASRRLVSFDSPPTAEHEPLASRLSDTAYVPADEAADHAEQRERLMGAMSELPPRQRLAISLALFDGLPLRAIGEQMGISESRVCQLQKRAVRQLQRVFSEPPYLEHAS
jgi:RNA polymerase sigma factor for flagellar operon FliA